jgi:hypothetical protein
MFRQSSSAVATRREGHRSRRSGREVLHRRWGQGLREARFFLDKMSEHEHLAFGGKEPFEFYLSAFLSAGRTVDYRLRHEQGATYSEWRTAWDATLTWEQQALIKFMVDERNVEVHESGGSTPSVETMIRELKAGTYRLPGGTYTIAGPPGATLASVPFSAYCFTIDGTDRRVTEACGEYLALLEQMVAKFKADHT